MTSSRANSDTVAANSSSIAAQVNASSALLWIMLVGPVGSALMSLFAALQAFSHRPAWPWGLCAGAFVLYGRHVARVAHHKADAGPSRVAAAAMVAFFLLASSLWVYARMGGGRPDAARAGEAVRALVRAVVERDQTAFAKALPDVLASDEHRNKHVDLAHSTEWLDSLEARTRQRLEYFGQRIAFVSLALAAHNLIAAEQLVREGYGVGVDDRVLLAENLATAGPEVQERWGALMQELAGSRERDLKELALGRSPSIDAMVARAMLQQAGRFSARFDPLFTDADAAAALEQCNTTALQYTLPRVGSDVKVDLWPALSRLIDADANALTSTSSTPAPRSTTSGSVFDPDSQEHQCLGTLRWALQQAPATPGPGGYMVFQSPLGTLGLGGGLTGAPPIFRETIDATHVHILKDLRSKGVMSDISDEGFDAGRLQRHLQDHPPVYTNALKATVLLLEKEPQEALLSPVLQFPLLYHFHPQFSADAQAALRRWNERQPSADWRAALRDELNLRARVVYEKSNTAKQQIASLRRLLETAGFRCQVNRLGSINRDSQMATLKC